MDGLDEGLGERIGGLGCTLPTMALLLSLLLVIVAGGVVAGADKKAKDLAAIETLKGADYRMASAKIAKTLTRYADPANDQLHTDGSPVTEAPKWTDIKAVHVAVAKMPAKLLTKMGTDYPPGTSGSFYGDDVALTSDDRIVFVAVEMARRLPAGSRGQQVEIGFSGDAATPVQVGTDMDTRAGVETFTLSGLFSNGGYGTGTTDVSGRQPGLEIEPDEYYNADSGVFGFYDAKTTTWYVVLPRAADVDSIAVSVRSSTGAGQLIDRLDLPGGGHFIHLKDPTGGFKSKSGLSPLTCRALETFSGEAGVIELTDPSATLIRYTAGINASVDVDVDAAAELLAPAIEAMGPVRVTLTPVGLDAEPTVVDADLAVSPEGNAISLSFEAPEGQWVFALADELKLKTPTGERIVDHISLTGTAGVQTGPGLDGYVAGDLSCVAGATEEPATEEDEAA
jgi:hypothetical protein